MPKSIVKSTHREEGVSRYVSVKIPKELMDEIDKIVSTGTLGYRSRIEFIKDAVRDKLLRLKIGMSSKEKW